MTLSVQPINIRMSFPYVKPKTVKIRLRMNAITTECSAALSAFTLSLAPINLAIDAVTPLPKPKVKPIIKKKIGKLNATAAIDSPPSRPINIMSIIVYKVCIAIPAIIGIANLHKDLDGLSIKDFKRLFLVLFEFIEIV